MNELAGLYRKLTPTSFPSECHGTMRLAEGQLRDPRGAIDRMFHAKSSYDSSIFKCSPISLPGHSRRKLQSTVRANAGDHHQISITKTTKRTLSLTPRSHNSHQDPSVKQSFPSKSKQWVHFIGIGGNGLSALAFYALKKGWHVTGSDISWSKKLDTLQRDGATVYVGHHESQLWAKDGGRRLPDHVVFSAAIPPNNVELLMAQKLGLQIHKRGPWLAQITRAHNLIAVSGSHGKSTTTAMISMVLKDIETSISSIVGADVPQFPGRGSVMYGSGTTFILEADEYDGCFLHLRPQIVVITNVDWEHVDLFPNEEAVKEHFRQFCRCLKADGTLIFCGDSESARSVASEFMLEKRILEDEHVIHQVISYGLGEKNVWRAVMIEQNTYGGSDYLATCNGEVMTRVQIRLPGLHNVMNSLAAVATAVVIASQNHVNDPRLPMNVRKKALEAASRALHSFKGVRRRFEFVGMVECCQIYDDYAHHPTEIRASLESARQTFGKTPVWIVFQPQDYSRVGGLLKDFAAALAGADRVIVTKIYGARGENSCGVSGEDIVNHINRTAAVYIPGLDDVCAFLLRELSAMLSSERNDKVVILTMGTGSITNLGPKLLQKLSEA